MNSGTKLLSKAQLIKYMCDILEVNLEELATLYPSHTIEFQELVLIYKNQYFLRYRDAINQSINEYFEEVNLTQNEFCKSLYHRIVLLDQLVDYELENDLNRSIRLLSLSINENQYSNNIYTLVKVDLAKLLTNKDTIVKFDQQLKLLQNKLNT